MEDMYSQIRRDAKESADAMLEEIRESKHGRLKLEAISAIPLVMGATLGGIGRATGANWIPAVPIGMDLMHNATGYTTARGLWGLVKYGVGVALPYADIIYSALQDKF